MRRKWAGLAGLCLAVLGGCNPMAGPPEASAPNRTEARRPADSAPANPPRAVGQGGVKVAWDTRRDQTYAEFLRDHSAGMIKDATVCIERKGVMDVQIDQSVAPDDTLELTKSLMSGARKDFPDQPILLKIFDPSGAAILSAQFRPGEGVRYQIANEGATRTRVERDGPATAHQPASTPTTTSAASSEHPGTTEKDRRFASWAETTGKAYLRYVEADLEKHGRLWIGVTPEVKPSDVKPLTRSVLEGAQREFPGRDLVATVFDPHGERIGRAMLRSNGAIEWER
ncbi:hypothetical protein TA3x_003054 [Tundrisphaera sp. TA3]|uniref:hypothetical protein n=1 Tax=Tundrisphaera sp. TA3 TaxID=3435775 RepID=UPI003EBCCC8B